MLVNARSILNPVAADDLLCGKRLTGRAKVCPHDEGAEQKHFDDSYEIKGVFDCPSYRVSRKNISANLSFSLAEIDVEALSHFAMNSGKLIVDLVSQMEDEPAPKADDGPQTTLFDDEKWREEPIETLDNLSIAALKKLREGGLTTIGKLATYTSAGFGLASLVGKKHAEEVEKSSREFFDAHPECAEAAKA